MCWNAQFPIAEIFVSIATAIITGGLILGFRNVIGDIKMFDGKSLTENQPVLGDRSPFLWLIGEAIFHFLPVGVCWATVRKLGGSEILRDRIGYYTVGQSATDECLSDRPASTGSLELWSVRDPESRLSGTGDSCDPGWCAAGVYRNTAETDRTGLPLSGRCPVCFVTAAGVILAHSLIGPFGRWIGDGVAFAAKSVMTGSFAPIGASLFGFLYAPLVITGVHHTTNAVDLQLVQSMGGTPIWPLIALSNIAQASAVMGIILISRKEKRT